MARGAGVADKAILAPRWGARFWKWDFGLKGSRMENKLLNEQVLEQVQEVFTELKQPVQVLFFGSSKTACDYCEDTLQLLKEVTALSDKLGLSEYDLDVDVELAKKYHVDKAPGFILAGKDGEQIIDYGVLYSGIPAGHEFGSLIHDLVLVSGRDSGLSQKARNFLAGLRKPVHLQVFVTPT
jgi:alkyl hydroperoxide reductase subunit AhpF